MDLGKTEQMITITPYTPDRELEWLDIHASIMVDSVAWWTVLHKKPTYKKPIVDLIALKDNKIIGMIVIEINSNINRQDHPAGFVWEFGVHRNERGKGIGKKLIHQAHNVMKEKFNINKSIWYSQDKFAQKYYMKMGMKEIARHLQFTVYPDRKLETLFFQKGFSCWNMRGSCTIDDWEYVQSNFEVEMEDETLRPRLCIGYKYIE